MERMKRVRERMGLKAFVRGQSGRRLALRGASKNRLSGCQVVRQSGTATTTAGEQNRNSKEQLSLSASQQSAKGNSKRQWQTSRVVTLSRH